jgi:hypothetical protein
MMPHQDRGPGKLEKAQRGRDFLLSLKFEQHLVEGHVLGCREGTSIEKPPCFHWFIFISDFRAGFNEDGALEGLAMMR